MPSRSKMDEFCIEKAVLWWDAEVHDWMVNHTKDRVVPHDLGVWFENPTEAMLFKLTFAGSFKFKE